MFLEEKSLNAPNEGEKTKKCCPSLFFSQQKKKKLRSFACSPLPLPTILNMKLKYKGAASLITGFCVRGTEKERKTVGKIPK